MVLLPPFGGADQASSKKICSSFLAFLICLSLFLHNACRFPWHLHPHLRCVLPSATFGQPRGANLGTSDQKWLWWTRCLQFPMFTFTYLPVLKVNLVVGPTVDTPYWFKLLNLVSKVLGHVPFPRIKNKIKNSAVASWQRVLHLCSPSSQRIFLWLFVFRLATNNHSVWYTNKSARKARTSVIWPE